MIQGGGGEGEEGGDRDDGGGGERDQEGKIERVYIGGDPRRQRRGEVLSGRGGYRGERSQQCRVERRADGGVGV